MQDEGPSGERETNFILIHDDDIDMSLQSAKIIEISQEQQT